MKTRVVTCEKTPDKWFSFNIFILSLCTSRLKYLNITNLCFSLSQITNFPNVVKVHYLSAKSLKKMLRRWRPRTFKSKAIDHLSLHILINNCFLI